MKWWPFSVPHCPSPHSRSHDVHLPGYTIKTNMETGEHVMRVSVDGVVVVITYGTDAPVKATIENEEEGPAPAGA